MSTKSIKVFNNKSKTQAFYRQKEFDSLAVRIIPRHGDRKIMKHIASGHHMEIRNR